MHPILFATTDLRPDDQFEAFRAAYEPIKDIRPVAGDDGAFDVSQRIWPLGKLVLTSTTLPGRGHALRWQHWERAVLDHWYVILPCRFVDGQAVHREPAMRPRIHSLARPLAAQMPDDGALALYIPRDLFASSMLDEMLDVPLEGAAGALLADMMLALDRRLPELDPAGLDHVVEALRCFVAACASPSADRRAAAQAPIDLALLERARRLIRRRLAELDLSPDAICRELGVSRSRLYRLFEPLGGISSYVRRQRLMQTRHALLDTADGRPINRIAEQWGFADASVFSRSFRQEFGLSPKAAREAGRIGILPPGGGRGAGLASADMPSLADLLRMLAA
ncbi:helix-turn-helix transcriptional regulator [Ancylobacter sp. MQZ15Z-1]|uniref:Helix-turn-helix transcriptional regulator n=1 Tax=Ancylobacter mangrovi TaxID=2972472 RepID=A0A9X2PB65_9HYPH|nr:helix-turn-helix transcriptional regulator [Ancylobacter mangrovi]MCS0495567.1 helix-turn-helix transcriptional regulator [Ancylobacter mangrovi]